MVTRMVSTSTGSDTAKDALPSRPVFFVVKSVAFNRLIESCVFSAKIGAEHEWRTISVFHRERSRNVMRTRHFIILIGLSLLSLSSASFAQDGTCAGMDTGPGADLNGFIPFLIDNAWNTDISSMPIDPNSDNIIAFIGASSELHPDFGAGLYNGSKIGIPYQVVDTTIQPMVPIKIVAYKTESDPGPMPVPPNALIEGYPNPDDGDRHVLVLDRNGCWLYELYHGFKGRAAWKADSAAVWDMTI